nr:hypothetical protein [Paenibacillus larvae]
MAGLLAAWLFQGHSSVAEWFRVMQQGYKENIPNETVAAIVNRGGLHDVVDDDLILIALSLAGVAVVLRSHSGPVPQAGTAYPASRFHGSGSRIFFHRGQSSDRRTVFVHSAARTNV